VKGSDHTFFPPSSGCQHYWYHSTRHHPPYQRPSSTASNCIQPPQLLTILVYTRRSPIAPNYTKSHKNILRIKNRITAIILKYVMRTWSIRTAFLIAVVSVGSPSACHFNCVSTLDRKVNTENDWSSNPIRALHFLNCSLFEEEKVNDFYVPSIQ
jgi:hypothetical protein